MRERPILFSGPMVRMILAGTKSQTRRIVKPQPLTGVSEDSLEPGDVILHPCNEHGGLWPCCLVEPQGRNMRDVGWLNVRPLHPYGQPGDRLWVRETWRVYGGREYEYQHEPRSVIFRADFYATEGDGWRPAIHMPRWASRILLEITDVRVQRLREISREDAKAEGATDSMHPDIAIEHFAQIWNSIHGEGHFADVNPWVWAITFRRIEQ